MDIFFVLSGYLITGILTKEAEKTGTLSFARFFSRRAARLMPALALFLLTCALAHRLLWPENSRLAIIDLTASALYLTDILQAIFVYRSPVQHTWSLALEAQFYAIWPLVILALARMKKRNAVAILLSAWLTVTAMRCWAVYVGKGDFAFFSPLRCTGLILGSALALHKGRLPSGWFGLFIVAVCFAIPRTNFENYTMTTATEIGSALLILNPPTFLAFAPLAWLGRISYGFYLWHGPIWQLVSDAGIPMPIIAAFVASLTVSAASYYGLEQWFLRRPTSIKTVKAYNSSRQKIAAVDGKDLN